MCRYTILSQYPPRRRPAITRWRPPIRSRRSSGPRRTDIPSSLKASCAFASAVAAVVVPCTKQQSVRREYNATTENRLGASSASAATVWPKRAATAGRRSVAVGANNTPPSPPPPPLLAAPFSATPIPNIYSLSCVWCTPPRRHHRRRRRRHCGVRANVRRENRLAAGWNVILLSPLQGSTTYYK